MRSFDINFNASCPLYHFHETHSTKPFAFLLLLCPIKLFIWMACSWKSNFIGYFTFIWAIIFGREQIFQTVYFSHGCRSLWRLLSLAIVEMTILVVPISRKPLVIIRKLFLQWTKKSLGRGVGHMLVDWSLPVNR